MLFKKEKKRRLTIRGILSLLVIVAMVRQFFLHNYEGIFVGVLTLILFGVPTFIERKTDIDLPPVLEGIIYCFIFAAEILGELNSFYTKIPYWDTMLHTMNGFLMAAIGFALVDIFNRSDRFSVKLSPLFLAIVAFCFSMTVGVLWEFFEFGVDTLFHKDMQKDTVIHSFASVTLDETKNNIPIYVSDITDVTINGESLELGGYLDIGLYDTMEDLFVNFIGAVLFSVVGFFNAKSKGKSKIASAFIPTIREEDDSSGLEGAFDEDP